MCDMFICIPDDPIEDDPRYGNMQTWKVAMKDAPVANPAMCCYGCMCGPCAQYQLRQQALGGTLKEYRCCQGYIWPMSERAGQCGESSCPECCLCLEVCCCNGCALSATRFLIMDQKNLKSDPCDNRIIRFNNFMQLLSCICDLLSICIEELREAAAIIRCIANIVYCVTSGCMTGQMFYELDEGKGPYGAPGGGAPPQQTMHAADVSGAKPAQGVQMQGISQQQVQHPYNPPVSAQAEPVSVQGGQIPVAQATPVAAYATPVTQNPNHGYASGHPGYPSGQQVHHQ
mmetsp:Transcript_16145/g.19241  ORF Transcript_16145/g.19241 Transcript_16145/m.19241 type:complete len:287 (-) Transcript_16145:71-931(-)